MNILTTTLMKSGVNLVTSLGVSTIVKNAINMNTPEKVGKLAKAGIFIGGFFLSNMVSEKIGDYAEGELDKWLEIMKGFKIEIKKTDIKEEPIEVDFSVKKEEGESND